METNNSGFGQDLIYDLRQYYANIVGQHLVEVSACKKAKSFPKYFQALKDLYVVVKHKMKKPKEGQEDYDELLKEAIDMFNSYPEVYLGIQMDTEGYHKIEAALNKIDMFLLDIMDDANMFGSNRKVQGL